jgi:hypothetical protein
MHKPVTPAAEPLGIELSVTMPVPLTWLLLGEMQQTINWAPMTVRARWQNMHKAAALLLRQQP